MILEGINHGKAAIQLHKQIKDCGRDYRKLRSLAEAWYGTKARPRLLQTAAWQWYQLGKKPVPDKPYYVQDGHMWVYDFRGGANYVPWR